MLGASDVAALAICAAGADHRLDGARSRVLYGPRKLASDAQHGPQALVPGVGGRAEHAGTAARDNADPALVAELDGLSGTAPGPDAAVDPNALDAGRGAVATTAG